MGDSPVLASTLGGFLQRGVRRQIMERLRILVLRDRCSTRIDDPERLVTGPGRRRPRGHPQRSHHTEPTFDSTRTGVHPDRPDHGPWLTRASVGPSPQAFVDTHFSTFRECRLRTCIHPAGLLIMAAVLVVDAVSRRDGLIDETTAGRREAPCEGSVGSKRCPPPGVRDL